MGENGLMRFLSRIADLIILNLLWLVCSIPIITIGASTTALYAVMLKIVKNEEGYMVRGFLEAFRQNFKKSTVIWLIILVIGTILGIDLWVSGVGRTAALSVVQVLALVMAAVLVSVAIYSFALQARFENTVKNTMKNAWILTFARLPHTVVMLILTIGSFGLTFVNVKVMMYGLITWSMIGVSVVTWLNCILLKKIVELLEEEAKRQAE